MLTDKEASAQAVHYAMAEKYVAKRKRLRRIKIMTIVSAIGVTVMSMVALLMQKTDRFTITATGSDELSLSEHENLRSPASKLYAEPLTETLDCQYTDIPKDIELGVGSKNCTKNDEFGYFAYSFYLIGNNTAGENTQINYNMDFTLVESTNDLDEALRIMIIKDGIQTIYSKADETGKTRPLCTGKIGATEPDEVLTDISIIPFKTNEHIIMEPYTIDSGTSCKYTIVMWIDGWETTESMKNGVIDLNLRFSVLNKNNVNKE